MDKKKYVAPEIVFETDLEVKAGSPCPKDSDLDILFPEQ